MELYFLGSRGGRYLSASSNVRAMEGPCFSGPLQLACLRSITTQRGPIQSDLPKFSCRDSTIGSSKLIYTMASSIKMLPELWRDILDEF